MRLRRIPLRPPRHPGEGAAAYLMRLARANGYSGARELAGDLGIPWHTLAAGRSLRRFAAAACCDETALAFDTAITRPDEVRLRGETLGRRHWSLMEGRKACPACFALDRGGSSAEDAPSAAWSRSWWDLKVVTTCAIHGVLLSTRCACGEKLAFDAGPVDACACGKAIPPGADAGSARSDLYLVGRLSHASAAAAPRVRNEFLDAMSLGDAIAALTCFGRCLTPDRSVPVHARLDRAFDAFIDWPGGLHGALDEISSIRGGNGDRWGAEAAYGPIVSMARSLEPGDASSALRLEIARHAATTGIARAAKPVLGIVVPDPGRLTLTQAGKALGVGFDRAKTLLDAIGKGKGTPAMLAARLVRKARERLDAQTDLKGLQCDLRIGKTQVRRLVEAGIVEKDGDGKIAVDAGQRLIAALLARRTPVRATPLPLACRRARTPLPVACKAILTRRVDVDEVLGVAGLARVGVEVRALRTVGKDQRGDGMTIEEAATRLGEKWQVVRDLVEFGLIRRDHSGKIDRTSVEQFARDYIPGAALARRLGTSPKHLAIFASGRGVRPAISPPRARKAFYRAIDATKLS